MDVTPVRLGETDRTLNCACLMLLRVCAPVAVADLAAALDEEEAALEPLMAQYERLGRMKRDGATVVASLGVSVVPSEFEIRFGTRRLWAWCAKTALGIVGALGVPGVITGLSPVSRSPLTVTVDGAGQVSEGLVVFWPDDSVCDSCGSAEREYCPIFRLLEDEPTARSWARDMGYSGEVLSTREATARATAYYAPILDLDGRGRELTTIGGTGG